MSLKKYLLVLKIYITIFSYFVLGVLLRVYPTRLINNEFYFYLSCLLFGFASGLIFCGVTHLYDWYPFEPLTLSFDETKILSDDINSIAEKNFKNQEEIKSAKKEIYIWLIAATTIICCTLLFST